MYIRGGDGERQAKKAQSRFDDVTHTKQESGSERRAGALHVHYSQIRSSSLVSIDSDNNKGDGITSINHMVKDWDNLLQELQATWCPSLVDMEHEPYVIS